MKWIVGLFLSVAGLLVTALLLIVLGLQLPVTASWLTQTGLSGLLDARVTIDGSVQVSVLPQLRVQARDIHVCARTQEPCASGVSLPTQEQWVIGEAMLVLEWRELLQKGIRIPVLAFSEVAVSLPHEVSGQASQIQDRETTGAQAAMASLRSLLLNGWKVRIDDLTVNDLSLVSGTSEVQDLSPMTLRRVRVNLDAHNGQGRLTFTADDVYVPHFLLGEFGQRLGQDLQAQTVRGELDLEADLLRIDSLTWIGTTVRIEQLSGWFNLGQRTLLVQFEADMNAIGQGQLAPGFQVRLRRSRVPVTLTGSWSDPQLQVGEISADATEPGDDAGQR